MLALSSLLVVSGCSGETTDEGPSQTAASSGSPAAADTLVQTALQHLDEGSAAKARATFKNALELDPDNVYAHYNLGLLAQDVGRDALAIKEYDAALEADPEFTSALYNKGIVLESGDLEAAVDVYQRVLAIDPDLAAAHMRLGFVLLHLGETDKAEEHLSTGVELDPAMAKVQAPSYG